MAGNDSYTVSLLHLNGADASIAIHDDANNGGHLWVARGTAQIDTSQYQFGVGSLLLDGNSDWLDTPDSADWNFASAAFTIDFWVRFSSLPVSGDFQTIVTHFTDVNHRWTMHCENASGLFYWGFINYAGGGDTIAISGVSSGLSTGVWYHISLTRSGNTWRFFQDGVQCGGDITDTGAVGNQTGLLYVGVLGDYATPHYFNGWLDELRISKGIARWTAGFTPPIESYKTTAQETALWTSWWNFIGGHWNLESTTYDSGTQAGNCKNLTDDETLCRVIYRAVNWGSIRMVGRFRTSQVESGNTCYEGVYYPIASTGNAIQALQFGGNGHFAYNDGAGNPNHTFPTDKTYVADTWYTWDVTFDFANSLQYTKVDGVDLGNITLKDIAGNTLNATHSIIQFLFEGSSDSPGSYFYMDSIAAYSYPGNVLLFNFDFENTPMPWLQGWGYRKSTTLDVPAGDVTNYQMKLKVYYGSGTDGTESVEGVTAGKVYCNSKCKTDFSDIRVTKLDGVSVLDMYLESKVDSNYAIFWIECDVIHMGATPVYVYYGNAGAASVSNGANTFIVFDDFERGANNDVIGGAWTVASGSVIISTEQSYFGSRSAKWVGGTTLPGATISVTASANISIMLRIFKEDAAMIDLMHGNGTTRAIIRAEADEDMSVYDGATYVDTTKNITADAWQLLELNQWNWSSKLVDVWLNGLKIKDNADISYANSSIANLIYLYQSTGAAGVDTYIDDLMIRNWRATEPAWGTWGSEEGVLRIPRYGFLIFQDPGIC